MVLFQVNPCPPCTEESKTGYNTAGVLSEGRGEGKNSIPPATGVAFPSAVQVLLASFDAGVHCSSATCCLLGPAGPFLQSCFPSSPSPWIQAVIPPQLQGSAFCLVNCIRHLSSPFSHVLRSRWTAWQHSYLVYQPLPVFYHLQGYAEVYICMTHAFILCQPNQSFRSSLDIIYAATLTWSIDNITKIEFSILKRLTVQAYLVSSVLL